MAVVTAVGWALIASAVMRGQVWPSAGSALLFLVVVVAARALAFPMAGRTEVSLDSGVFIAATACLGLPATALGVAVVMVCDRLMRTRSIAEALYMGGLSGGLLVVWAGVFGVGRGQDIDFAAAWLVPVLGLAFLISHYLIQSLELRLSGRSFRALVGGSTRSVIAEASLLPLAAAIVLIWEPGRPLAFALLGATYLLVNLGFNRLAKLASALRRRVSELETLNRTAHVLGGSLERPQIMSALLVETARALAGACRVEATLIDAGRVVRYTHQPGMPETREFDVVEARLVRAQKEPSLDSNVHDLERPEVAQRMTVPLSMHGECVGVLSAESQESDMFTSNELRLLDAIGGQAAAAVENARLYALANVDGLTGLYCRRYLDIRITEEIERGRRFGTSFALVLLDLDNFKMLNDTLGHVAGDRALREVAAIAASQLRGVDLAARYGGEELAFLLPRTSVADAHAVAERIREAVASHAFSDNGKGFRITASLGVAGWSENGGDAQNVLRRSDEALYRAKKSGKNRVDVDLQHFELTPSLAPVRRRARS